MAFKDLYPLAAFAAVADVSWWRASDLGSRRNAQTASPEQQKAARDLDNADQARLKDHQETVLHPAVLAHLQGLRSNGLLKPTGGIAGRDCWIATAWNAFIAGEEDDYHTKWMIDAIARGVFTRTFVRMDERRHSENMTPGVHVPPSADNVEAAWAKICSALDGGTSGEGWNGWNIEITDANTGDRGEMTFEAWTGMLMVRNAQHQLEPAQDVGSLPLVAVEVDLPTGQLLITDAVRIDAFNEATDLGDAEYREASLNSEKGCVRRTELFSERFGIGFCQTTNTALSIRVSDADGSIAFLPAYDEVETPGWTAIEGSLDCGVWSIMAMDRSTAEKLIGAGGASDPADMLDRLIALDDPEEEGDTAGIMAGFTSGTYMNNVLRLDVRPGTWTLHSGHEFAERVDHAAFGLPADARPWAILQSPRS